MTGNNVAPTWCISWASVVDEGEYTLALSSNNDPGGDTISSWEINWGDGDIETVQGNPGSVPHRFDGDATYTITARATDEDGTYDANELVINVGNVAPTIDSLDVLNTTPLEGGTVTLQVLASDPGNDLLNYEFDFDYDRNFELSNGTGVARYTFADDSLMKPAGTFIVGVRVSDGDGAEADATFQVTVANVQPTG